MFRITFKNKLGVIVMSGSSQSKMGVTALSGFGNPERVPSTVTFTGRPGVTTTSIHDAQRVMTVSGVFRGVPHEIREIYKILYEDGILAIHFHDIKRAIEARCTTPEPFSRLGKSGLYSFALQFQADYPYFTDDTDIVVPIYKREDLVTTTFTLPCVFTERTNAATVKNCGDRAVYPIIKISCAGNEVSPASEESGILITNRTTGAFIKLLYPPSPGEVVTIDLPVRRIVSSTGEVLTNRISDDTVLSEFFLELGGNEIEAVSYVSGVGISANLIYRNEYNEAVY